MRPRAFPDRSWPTRATRGPGAGASPDPVQPPPVSLPAPFARGQPCRRAVVSASAGPNDPPPGAPVAPPAAAALVPRRLVLLALGALVLVGLVLGWRGYRHRQERQEALRRAGAGDFAGAEPLLQRALERRPHDLEVVQALARGHLDAHNPAQAETCLGRWCELRPDDAEPFKLRLKLYGRQKRHDK